MAVLLDDGVQAIETRIVLAENVRVIITEAGPQHHPASVKFEPDSARFDRATAFDAIRFHRVGVGLRSW